MTSIASRLHQAALIAALTSTACGGSSDTGGTDGSIPYGAESRTIVSSGASRSFLLATPEDAASQQAMPLVFVLHGDGGNASSARNGFDLEAHATRPTLFVYPNVNGNNTFEYYSYDGRARESQFIRDVIEDISAEFDIDVSRVFIVGFSGGATMANALGCHLGPAVIRGLGIHSGTLYPTMDGEGDPDFTYTGAGGVSCPLPATIFVWGQNDSAAGVSFANGEGVRNNYLATQACETTTTPSPVSACARYDGCERDVVWCPIPSLGHQIWSGAGDAIWAFFDDLP